MSEHNEGEFAAWTWKQVTGLLALLSAVPVVIGINTAYVHWHDGRYALKTEIVGNARAKELKEEVGIALAQTNQNSGKLDVQHKQITQLSTDFSTYAASMMVSSARQELRAHMQYQDNTIRWREEKDKLEERLKQAELYQTCVMAGKVNCLVLMPR